MKEAEIKKRKRKENVSEKIFFHPFKNIMSKLLFFEKDLQSFYTENLPKNLRNILFKQLTFSLLKK